jgi:hypothetical protein
MRPEVRLLLAVVAGFVPAIAAAEASQARALEWETERVTLAPSPGVTEATARFKFTNRGAAVVHIRETRSSCGCTVAALDRDTFQPGESGVIRAHFAAGEREGAQSVSIAVVTDEPRAEPYVLTLVVEMQLPVRVVPRFMHWRIGEQPAPKSAQVRALPGWTLVSAQTDTDAFSVELVPPSDGEGPTELRVTPRDTWAKREGRIKLTARSSDATTVESLVWVRVL